MCGQISGCQGVDNGKNCTAQDLEPMLDMVMYTLMEMVFKLQKQKQINLNNSP